MQKRSRLGDKKHSKTGQFCPVFECLIGLIQRKLIKTSLDRSLKKRVIKIFYS
jgi:hypothetical protein